MLGQALAATVLLVALIACEKPRPQLVLWVSKDGIWQANSEHLTLAECQSAADDLAIFGEPGSWGAMSMARGEADDDCHH